MRSRAVDTIVTVVAGESDTYRTTVGQVAAEGFVLRSTDFENTFCREERAKNNGMTQFVANLDTHQSPGYTHLTPSRFVYNWNLISYLTPVASAKKRKPSNYVDHCSYHARQRRSSRRSLGSPIPPGRMARIQSDLHGTREVTQTNDPCSKCLQLRICLEWKTQTTLCGQTITDGFRYTLRRVCLDRH